MDNAIKELKAYGIFRILYLTQKHGQTFSVAGPNRFLKYSALRITSQRTVLSNILVTNATICRLSSMSFLETTEKYATLMKRYTAVTEHIASGAARLIVRTGSRTSDKA